jgi:UDP-N-acetylglucosamine/UDP-N-acetylgalactosamine diphosphorylase
MQEQVRQERGADMTYQDAKRVLEQYGQEHVLKFWECLTATQQASLLGQIEALDFKTIARIQALLKAGGESAVSTGAVTPAPVVSLAPGQAAAPRAVGEAALKAGQVGVILVAGGQGTRLGYDGPKGTYRLAPITQASLFEIHARKILALEQQYQARIPFYIMTSEGNDADTRAFFEANRYFGLSAERVKFFIQGTLPAFLPDGRIILEAPDKLFAAPDGHGGIMAALERRGMLADMKARTLTTLYYFQVDNPLVDIADPVFIGLHLQRKADMSLKVCAKRDAGEGLGVTVIRDGRCSVVEYIELTEEQKNARQPDGELVLKFGSVAIHIFSLDFLVRETSAGLPLHQALKKVAFCDDKGVTIKPEKPNACKFEKFIFDALPDAKESLILEFLRQDEFAPVKNAEGNDSPASSRAAMIEKFAGWFARCGVKVPRDAGGQVAVKLEVDPVYAHDAETLAARLPKGFEIKGDVLLK